MISSNHPKILLCDHGADSSASCIRFFTDNGFEVKLADGVGDCLAMVRECVLDVLIVDSDERWHGPDGVLESLRRQGDLPTVPIVVVIGRESPAEMSRRTGIPAALCLKKPLKPVAVYDAIVKSARQMLNDLRSVRENTEMKPRSTDIQRVG